MVLRDYPNSQAATATPTVRTALGEDLYVMLLASDPATGTVTLHLFVNRLVVWIWTGGAIMGIGARFSVWPERRGRRVAVEQPQRAPGPPRSREPEVRHLRWLLVPLLVIPLAWLLFTGFGRDPREVSSPLIGRPAPTWTLASLDGRTLSSERLAGRPYVLNFWASWCIPCIEEHRVLADAYDRYGDEVVIVGVLYNDEPTAAEGFLARYGDAGYAHVNDDSGRLAIDFGVTGPPETFFVDARGVVRDKQFGPLTEGIMGDKLASIGIGR